MALFAAVLGGVAGYGTGALMPLILVPIVGAEPVVPILAISALINNQPLARVPPLIDWRRVLVVLDVAPFRPASSAPTATPCSPASAR